VELRDGDVEVREVRELVLDLGEVDAVLRRDGFHVRGAAYELLLLLLELLDLLEEVAHRRVAGEVGPELAVLGLEVRDALNEAFVLAEELFRELGALAEELLDERVALSFEVLRRTLRGWGTPLGFRHLARVSPEKRR
jgi:hypothetical protein